MTAPRSWQPTFGQFDVDQNEVVFKGRTIPGVDGKPLAAVGNIISNQWFAEGTISARIRFETATQYSACQILMFYEPSGPYFITTGIGGHGSLFSVAMFAPSQAGQNAWQILTTTGDRNNLKDGHEYDLAVEVVGSQLTLFVDGVAVLKSVLPFIPPEGQVGIWCADTAPIHITNYNIDARRPTAFVVMQFTKPYQDLYADVIKPICEDEGLGAELANETYGPGLIIADIARKIKESRLVVAEITPPNPNVYYEVGYAHALNKPTILIAQKDAERPFDLSPFRTIFYENTIHGKRQIEEEFRKHLRALFPPRSK